MDENGIDVTMKKLFGNEIDCFTNYEFDGSNEKSIIFMDVVYANNVSNADKTYNEKTSIHSEWNLSSMVKPYTPVVNVDVPSRIVESFRHDIISIRCFTNVTLYSNSIIDGKDGKMDKQEISKFKYSSLDDIQKALDNQREEESGSKRELNIHYFLNRLRTHAFHLFVDVGWNVDRYKVLRSKPEKRVSSTVQSCSCKSPKGHVHNKLPGAWVACGEELHSMLLHPQYDEIEKMWLNKHDFYLDLGNTIAFVEKEEKALSPLLRWQLLDPFIAVVCIDKKISTLDKKGLALAAINSKTYVVEVDCCSFGGSSMSALVPTFDGKRENCADDQQLCYDADKNQSIRSLIVIDSNGGEEFFDEHPKENSSASNPETENRASENVGNSKKERKNKHSTENDSPKLTEEPTIRGSNVKRVLNFEGINTVEIQEVESNNMLPENVMFPQDPCDLVVTRQTYTMQQEQTVYLHTSQDTPYFSRSHKTNAQPISPSFTDTQQTMQSVLYNPPWSDVMQQAVQPFTFAPMTMPQQSESFPLQPNCTENDLVHEIVNFREESCSKKMKNQKRKYHTRSKKSSEIKEAYVTLLDKRLNQSFEHNIADENNIGFMNPPKKTISVMSDYEESHGKSHRESRGMVIEDSFCFVDEDDSSINETYKSHTELEPKSLKRDLMKMNNGSGREVVVGTSLKFNEIKSKACKTNNNGPFVSSSTKIKNPKVRTFTCGYHRTYTKRHSLQTSEKCDTKHPKTILGWLIDKGVILLNEVIQSINLVNKVLQKEGMIRRNGILCKCCNNLFCVSNFKSHASGEGMNFSNLFLGYKKTYTLCQLEALSAEYGERKGSSGKLENEYLDQNDDACALCGSGGHLVCCDGCPSSYHKSCLSSKEIPKGSWYCHHCICNVCSDMMNEVGSSSISMVTITCQQCEQKYHKTCIRGIMILREEVGSNLWFCRERCHGLFVALHSSIGKMISVGDGFYYTILRCNHGEQKFSSPQEIVTAAECHAKLAVALTVMEESFVPMIDSRTSIQMIQHVLYNQGSNFARLNYKGFYTIVLEREDEIICVASIRMNGVSVAEIPLIATSNKYRRQGMCRRLMSAIEELLKFLKVELLVLSTIPKWVDCWISGFGYRRMNYKEKKRLTYMNLVSFPGTVLLQKTLYEEKSSVEVPGITHPSDMKQLSSTLDKTSVEISTYQLQSSGLVMKVLDM